MLYATWSSLAITLGYPLVTKILCQVFLSYAFSSTKLIRQRQHPCLPSPIYHVLSYIIWGGVSQVLHIELSSVIGQQCQPMNEDVRNIFSHWLIPCSQDSRQHWKQVRYLMWGINGEKLWLIYLNVGKYLPTQVCNRSSKLCQNHISAIAQRMLLWQIFAFQARTLASCYSLGVSLVWVKRIVRSGAVITRSNMTWNCIHHCSQYWGRI